ncbi:DUF3276 family protein [Breznakiella homolactica]|uniref:DUF3276 family protein n=1 Tax=Breznakiella homolactica TaxID=2798577 RepID=UPI001CBA64E3|nr:DUF3276 family protein [Breznakiella homolactica]
MGIRGELFSTKVSLQNRTYFFNVKENRMGDLYLNIVESKNKDGGGFERQSVILFAEDLTEFLKGFDDSLRVLEKAAREKKRESGASRKNAAPRNDSSETKRAKPVVVRKGNAPAKKKNETAPAKPRRARSVKTLPRDRDS